MILLLFSPLSVVILFTYLVLYFSKNVDSSKTMGDDNVLSQNEVIEEVTSDHKNVEKDKNAETVDKFAEKIDGIEAGTKPLKKEKITKVVTESLPSEKKDIKITIKNEKKPTPIEEKSALLRYHKQQSSNRKNNAKKDDGDYIYFFIIILFFLVCVSVCYTANYGEIYTKSFLDKYKICVIDSKTKEVFFIGEGKIESENLEKYILPNLKNVFKINEEENIITFNNEKIDISNQKSLYKVHQEKKIEIESDENENLKNSEVKDSDFLKSEECKNLLLDIMKGNHFKKRKNDLSVNEVLPVLTFSGNNCSVLSAFYLTHSEEYRVLYSLLSVISAEDVLNALKKVMKDMIKKKKFLEKEYEKFNNLSKKEQINLIDFYLKKKLKLLYRFPDLNNEVKNPKKLKDFEEWENLNLGELTDVKGSKWGFGSARKKARYFIDPVDTLMTFGFYPGLTSGEIDLKYKVDEYKDINIGEFFTNSKYIVFSWGKVFNGLLVGETEEEAYSFVLADSSNLSDFEGCNAESKTVRLKISDKDFICGALPDTGYTSLEFEEIDLSDIKKYLDDEYVVDEQINTEKIYEEFKKEALKYFISKEKDNVINLIKDRRNTIKATLRSYCSKECYEKIKKRLEKIVRGCVNCFGNCSTGYLREAELEKILKELLEDLPEAINSIDKDKYKLDKNFFEKVKVLTTAKDFISQQSVEDERDIEKIAKASIGKVFTMLEEKILEKCEPEWNKKLSLDKQSNERKNFVKTQAEKKLSDLLNSRGEKIKKDISQNGFLPIGIMKKAIRKKIERKTNIKYSDEQYEKMWESGSLISHCVDGLDFFVDSVSKQVKKDSGKLKFNDGYNNEKMYIAAISLHSGRAGKEGAGHWMCLQPKYKWNKDKKEYVISKWVLLNCDGRAHTIFSNKEARDFLKEKFSQSSGDSNLQGCKQSVARIITKEEIEAAPDYYIMDDYGNMGKSENIRPNALSEKKSPIPDVWLDALKKVKSKSIEDSLNYISNIEYDKNNNDSNNIINTNSI